MEEPTTLVTGNANPHRGPSAGLTGAKERSASKALMRLRNLKADDIGVLRYTRSSELGTQTKCSNHAYDVASRKQVDMWHRHQRIAVGKLARGQQKMFRNLIRVQNEKRRIQRQSRIRKQREVQIELRERAVREREEAQKRLRDMIMTESIQDEEDEVPKDSGKTPSSRLLPEINEETDMEIDQLDNTSAVRKKGSGNSSQQSRRTKSHRSSHSDNDKRHERISSTKTSQSSSSTHLSHKSVTSKQTTPNADLSQELEAVVRANLPPLDSGKDKSFVEDSGRGLISRPHFSREMNQVRQNPRTTPSPIDTNNNGVPETIEGEDELPNLNPNKVLPGIITKTSQESYSKYYDDRASLQSNDLQDSVFGEDVTTATASKATDQTSKDKKRRKQSERTGPRNKYHIGIANRTFRLPDYQAPVVTSVVRYHRNSEGSLVPSEVAVKPASEEYKLPSRRAEYMVEKALEWEKRREDVREKKLQGFLDRMKELERKERMESRLGTSLDYARHEQLHQNLFAHHSKDRNPASGQPQPTPRTVHRSVGRSLEAYHLKGDVQDLRNCRYLRLNEEAVPGGAERAGHEEGKTAARRRRDRRMSSWGALGMPHGHSVTTGRLASTRTSAAQH